QDDIHFQAAFDFYDDRLAHNFLEAALFDLHLVAAGQNVHEGIITGCVSLHVVLFRGIQIRKCDGRIGNGSAAAIRNRSRDGSIHVLAPPWRGDERQKRHRQQRCEYKLSQIWHFLPPTQKLSKVRNRRRADAPAAAATSLIVMSRFTLTCLKVSWSPLGQYTSMSAAVEFPKPKCKRGSLQE